MAALTLGLIFGGISSAALADEGRGGTDEMDQAVQKQLDQVLPRFEYKGDLAGAIEYLRTLTKANISVNWRDLEVAGVPKDAPVNLTLHDVKFSKALELILDAVDQNRLMDYGVDDGVVIISTKDALGRNVRTHIYDVRECLIVVPNFNDSPARAPGQPGQAGIPADVDTRVSERPKTKQERVDDLIKMIEDISPDTWKDSGGVTGSIRELDGNLIITTTPKIHARIKDVMEQLVQKSTRMIRVRAFWVVADRSDIARIVKKVDVPSTAAQKPADSPLLEADPAEFEKLPGPHYEAQTLAISGKRARVSATYEQPFARPDGVAGADHAATYDTRVWLDAQTALSEDGHTATITLRPQAEDLERAGDSPQRDNSLTSQSMATSVRLPVGKTILIGSTALHAASHQADAPQLFLFIEVNGG
jgi:hypothetical protein